MISAQHVTGIVENFALTPFLYLTELRRIKSTPFLLGVFLPLSCVEQINDHIPETGVLALISIPKYMTIGPWP